MTRKRLIWLVLWFLSLVFVSIRGGAASYGFFFFFTMIPVISYAYLIVVLLQFGIYQDLESRVMVAGEPGKYTFKLQNEGFLTMSSIKVSMFPDFSYVENIPDGIEFELLPGETYTYDTRMVARYRGNVRVGVQKLILTDFLGLFTLRYRLPSTLEAIVIPRIPSPEEMQIGETAEIFLKENRKKQDEPDMTVRDYAEGDSMRRIHWNASAVSGKLKTRLYTGEQQNGVGIYFDALRVGKKPLEYLPGENRILELVLGLAQTYSLEGQAVSVGYARDRAEGKSLKITELENYSGFDSLYSEMQEVIFDSKPAKGTVADWAAQMKEQGIGQKLFVLLQRVTKAEAAELADLSDCGFELTVFAVDADPQTLEYLEGLKVLTLSGKEAII